MGQKRTFLLTALFALLAGGLFTSCKSKSEFTRYEIIFGFSEYTPPQDIADPDLRDLYVLMMDESMALKKRTDFTWETEIENSNSDRDDKQAEDKFNSDLALVKEFETAWRKRFEEFGAKSGSSLSIKFVLYVRRTVPANASSNYLKEYNYEINFN